MEVIRQKQYKNKLKILNIINNKDKYGKMNLSDKWLQSHESIDIQIMKQNNYVKQETIN